MTSIKTGAGVVRRPPTNAKLVRLLEELDATGNKLNPSGDDVRVHSAAVEAVRKVYKSGLPRGLDPAVVTGVIAAVVPGLYDLVYLTRKAGIEYDAAIVAGVRACRERLGGGAVLWAALVATLTEHAGVPIATANQVLRHAEKEVARDYETNLPADRSPAVLERVSAAMDAWFAPEVVAHTLALAREGMPPTVWSSGERHGVTPPQSDEGWALFIACALHPSEEAAALLAARVALIPRLAEPGSTAVCDVLRYAHSVHGARVPMPPG